MRVFCLFVVVPVATVNGCSSAASEPTSLAPVQCAIGPKITPATATLHFGDSLHAVATIGCPGTGVNADVRWSSSNVAIVSVDSVSGLVRAQSTPGAVQVFAAMATNRAIQSALIVQVVR